MNSGDKGLSYLVRAISSCISIDANDLTDGDFQFIAIKIRMLSYPEAPTFVRWTCSNLIHIDADKNFVPESETTGQEVLDVCGHETNELALRTTYSFVVIEDGTGPLPDFMDFPRMRTAIELEYVAEEDQHWAYLARWIRAGRSLAEKMVALELLTVSDYELLIDTIAVYDHGVDQSIHLRCKNCSYRTVHKSRVSLKTMFPDNTDKNIADIQYSLLTHFSLQPDPQMDARFLLYTNSCLSKDLKAAEETKRLAQANAKRR